MSRRVLPLVVTIALVSSCTNTEKPPVPPQPDVDTWTVATSDPITTIGHGVMVDAQGREIDATPGFVIGAQRFYIKNLYERANEAQRAEFKSRMNRIQGATPLSQPDEMAMNSALLGWLIDTVKPENAATLVMRHATLQIESTRLSKTKSPPSPALLDRLKREGLTIP